MCACVQIVQRGEPQERDTLKADKRARKTTTLRARDKRPTKYDPRVADRLCKLLVEGLSLRRICKRQDMPKLDRAIGWRRANPEFAKQYAMAREDQADTYADKIQDLVDSTTPQNANARRVQIDALKWTASKLKPHRYGDRLDLGLPVQPLEPDEMDVKDVARRIAYTLVLAGKTADEQRGEPRALLPAPDEPARIVEVDRRAHGTAGKPELVTLEDGTVIEPARVLDYLKESREVEMHRTPEEDGGAGHARKRS